MTLAHRCGPDWLDEKLAAGKHVLIDGATGTELEARGVPMNDKAWSGSAVLSHPEVVRETHADYIKAGAEVITTNTFASGRQLLEPAGLGDEFERINRDAVKVAVQARDEAADAPVAIAGSLCEWVAFDGDAAADLQRLSDGYRQQAALLVEENVDLMVLEMCSHPVHSRLLLDAALGTGLPVWLGLSCKSESGRLVGFDPPYTDLDPLLAELIGVGGVGVVNIMHTAIEDTAAALALAKRHWPGPLGVYPESGYFVMPNWQFVDIIEPDDLVKETRAWVESGAQIIGGCCGLGVTHIRALKAAFG